ncbi:MAG: adenine-specific methyltransferase EcoRI family protein [Defluviitaleaceae bacterium]|nr:adenine-specific methyltransferase EcoRI family protein [Defluviitaleaceae bacterium]MCL2203797.1 adenine-specific methyltransferase EcoRI family protein [Defluviitaleaceae bacterium]MCL2239266.1 adenine-specific methyltransferase EcoRI family protein [Defluviitaleaceae bacterium]
MVKKLLDSAKRSKADEFYTQLPDIEIEMRYYKEQFRGKTILCNCDDPYESNFFKYFAMAFNFLELKKLIATCYIGSPIASLQLTLFDEEPVDDKTTKVPHKIIITEVNDFNKDGAVDLSDVEWLLRNKKNTLTRLKGDGDFRSQECIELMKEADIIVTNPPFSLFREYITKLMEYDKKILIIGNVNAITYKEIFPLIMENKVWLGQSIHSGDREFRVPDYYPLEAAGCRVDEKGIRYIRVKGVRWFTNLDVPIRHEKLTLYKRYSSEAYPTYFNYNAIEVSNVADIPYDYDGEMGVPITFLDKYNPNQFEIIGSNLTVGTPMSQLAKKGTYSQGGPSFYVDNNDGTYKRVYTRIIIKRIGAAR